MKNAPGKKLETTADETLRRLEAQHLQVIEGNPLSPDQIAIFEMFEREGWSHERRLAYLLEQAKRRAVSDSAA